jgi:hypothetical protein
VILGIILGSPRAEGWDIKKGVVLEYEGVLQQTMSAHGPPVPVSAV